MKKIKDIKKFIKTIIDKQFEIAGYDLKYGDILGEPDDIDNAWYHRYTTTTKKQEEFEKWLRGYIKPYVFKAHLDREVGMLILNYGLKIED